MFARTAIKAVVSFSALAASGPAFASLTSERLCGGSGGERAQFPSSATLLQAAETATARLRDGQAATEGDPTAAAVAALEVADSTSVRPSVDALARYCSAAGEVMRLSASGSQRQAQVYLQTALRDARKADLPALTALVAYRLGAVWISGTPLTGIRGTAPQRRNGGEIVRKLRAAEAVESRSNEICSELNNVRTGAESDPAFSMLALDCAARLALESGQPAVSALSTLRYARFALDWRDSSDDPEALIADAREKALAALEVAKSVPNSQLRTELLGRLARTAIELGAGADPRLASVPAALRSTGGMDAAANSTAFSIEAQLALAAGDLPRARDLTERAILQESSRPLPVELPDLELLLSRADPANRQRHIAAAYLALQNLRPSLPRLDPLTEESMFALHMRRVFEAAADAQLELADGDDADARVATAQQIVEAFREAELQSAVGSECLPPRNPVDPRTLAANEILLYPLLFDDRLELIYVRGGSGSSVFRRLPANRATNKREVAKLVDTLKMQLTMGTGDGWREPAQRLYQLLIKPIEGQLSDNSTLAIIPDGALRGTPFAALTASDGRYLIQRTALTVAPALAYSQPGSLRSDPKLHIVAASLARKVSLPAGTFSALTGTKAEAQIAASNGHPGTLVPDFTREQLVSALSRTNVDVLHLATHAAFNGRSDRAFIVANGEVIRLSELRDILAQNRARGELLDLLVLSACETAVGDDESSMGLAGAAVQAGALSAIASLWQVDDAGTAELMRQFYHNYSGGASRAQSLRQAQLALIRGGGNQADPYVWAAFTLLGAWR